MRWGFRVTLQFLGLMAAGLAAAVVVALAVTGSYEPPGPATGAGGVRHSTAGLDYGSFGVGMACGIVLAWIGRITSAFQVRLALAWLFDNRRVLRRVSYGIAFVCILLYF
jgi:hypothetical protein